MNVWNNSPTEVLIHHLVNHCLTFSTFSMILCYKFPCFSLLLSFILHRGFKSEDREWNCHKFLNVSYCIFVIIIAILLLPKFTVVVTPILQAFDNNHVYHYYFNVCSYNCYHKSVNKLTLCIIVFLSCYYCSKWQWLISINLCER